MKVSKTENRFNTGFQLPKTGLPKIPVLTSLYTSRYMFSIIFQHQILVSL